MTGNRSSIPAYDDVLVVDPRFANQPSWPVALLRGLMRFTRKQPLGAVSAVLIAVLVVAALFASTIAPYSISERAGPPLTSPGSDYFMGTDHQGRDVFSRILVGAQTTVRVGLGAAAVATLGAVIIGLVSGFFGGVWDLVLQRFVDTVMAMPAIVIVLVLVAFLGGGETTIILVLGGLFAPASSRVIRGATLSVAGMTFVEAVQAVGASRVRIMVRHILPNIFAPTMVVGTLAVGNAILAEAALSFLGFGVTPPTPSWGGMLSGAGRQYGMVAPWLAIFPGLAITITVFAFNMLGDALRDVTDPRLRGSM